MTLPLRTAFLLALLSCFPACIDNGRSADCPFLEDYLEGADVDEDDVTSSPEFAEWRRDSEDQGCLTPVGGHDDTGSGGTSGSP